MNSKEGSIFGLKKVIVQKVGWRKIGQLYILAHSVDADVLFLIFPLLFSSSKFCCAGAPPGPFN